MQIDRDSVIRTFMAETEETLGQMEEALLQLEAKPQDDGLLGLIFRIVHMLKGNAGGLDLNGLSGFAHAVENLLAAIRQHEVAAQPGTINLLLHAVDALRAMVPAALAGTTELSPTQAELLTRLQNAAAGSLLPVAPAAVEPEAEQPASPALPEAVPATPEPAGARGLRVGAEKLDRLLNLAGEIGVAQGRLRQFLERFDLPGSEQLLEVLRESDRLTMELHEQVMELRMVPIGPTFRRYLRMARDLAHQHGKLARLAIEGEEAAVDTAVIEHIRDPLTHMIRNAIDHGIESPEVRRAAGKHAVGSLVLRAFREAGTIVIQLADDGAGLSRQKICQRAQALGIADPEKLLPKELNRLIFEPGFSTAEQVTETSGRGVGMDIVRRNIEALHGRVEVDSEEGRGVTVTIRLPLTLAIIQGFLVRVGREMFVLPLDTVLECVELRVSALEGRDGQGVMTLRGEALPFIRLRNLFHTGGAAADREDVVVVRCSSLRMGIVVDELCGEHQAVIKPLGNLFQNLPGISGSTILGDGRVALVLDVPGLHSSSLPEAAMANGSSAFEPLERVRQ
jgi:two-component system chemotaxis sensor kinase CheA